MFKVRRFVNTISINGYEYLLDDKGQEWEFQSKGQARRILMQNNIDLDTVEIIEESEEQ